MTSVVSPYGMPVTTGKPGIRLALSSFGFSQSPLPALCRQATTCAWRPRLRKIPDRRSAEVRVETGISGRPRQPKWPSAGTGPELFSGIGGAEARKRSKKARRNPTPTRAKRYAQCGFGDTCAPNHTNHGIFCTSRRDAKIAPQTGRAKRYAPCGSWA